VGQAGPRRASERGRRALTATLVVSILCGAVACSSSIGHRSTRRVPAGQNPSGHSRHNEASRFASVAEAVAFVRSKVDVPVPLPAPLPPGTRLADRHPVTLARVAGRTNAQLRLRFGAHGILDLQYGLSLFDGCGADAARRATVGGRPALASTSSQATWTELIWPATPGHPEGVYGVAGTFSLREALALARSMARARVNGRRITAGC